MANSSEKYSKDDIGTRFKENYENRYRIKLPRRTNTIIRIDMKSGHTYCRGMERPFDHIMMKCMNTTALYLCQNIQGAKFAYVQSDEISIVLTDYDDILTDAWFDGNIQKMVSVSAAMATAKFNQLRYSNLNTDFHNSLDDDIDPNQKFAVFDSRVFVIPEQLEVVNYFYARQLDAMRNSVQMVAQANFSPKQLHGISCEKLKIKLKEEKNIIWDDIEIGLQRGRVVRKINLPDPQGVDPSYTAWVVDEKPPIFSKNREYVLNAITKNEPDIVSELPPQCKNIRYGENK